MNALKSVIRCGDFIAAPWWRHSHILSDGIAFAFAICSVEMSFRYNLIITLFCT